ACASALVPYTTLFRSGKAMIDVGSVVLDVQLVALPERLCAGHDRVVVLPHLLGREVGVAPGTVPVAFHRLGVEGGSDVEVLGDRSEEHTSELQSRENL